MTLTFLLTSAGPGPTSAVLKFYIFSAEIAILLRLMLIPVFHNGLVALGGVSNQCKLVAIQKHCNQLEESNHVLKLFHLKFSISVLCTHSFFSKIRVIN